MHGANPSVCRHLGHPTCQPQQVADLDVGPTRSPVRWAASPTGLLGARGRPRIRRQAVGGTPPADDRDLVSDGPGS
jgi:hypothetical protein